MRDPVCPLELALYGHPDSGGYWERHCDRHLLSVGFEPVHENWRSCYWHPGLALFLVVYVDDFKLAGAEDNLTEGWRLIRSGLDVEDPHDVGQYLGCDHKLSMQAFHITGRPVRTIEYDMEHFMRSCVVRYTELTGTQTFRKVSTPFVDDAPEADEAEVEGSSDKCAAPNLFNHTSSDPSSGTPAVGQTHVSSHAARILMKILYGARMARWDLLHTVCKLACWVTKWHAHRDKQLYRHMLHTPHIPHTYGRVGWRWS